MFCLGLFLLLLFLAYKSEIHFFFPFEQSSPSFPPLTDVTACYMQESSPGFPVSSMSVFVYTCISSTLTYLLWFLISLDNL